MIPAGLRAGQHEFYWDGPQGLVISAGVQRPVEEMPAILKPVIDRAITKQARQSMVLMGILGADEQRIQFLKCNCSNSDYTPDIDEATMVLRREYVTCSMRGHCQFEGKLCSGIEVDGRKITMAQLRIVALIRKGLYDKEICDQLHIAPQTLRTHKQTIQTLLNADRKTGIALKAVEYGIS
jgi:DNA-binding CsgD family transcriptional regulator